MRVAIIEDSISNRNTIEQHLYHFSQEHNIHIDSVSFSNGSSFLKNFSPVWDLILLDIEMPGMTGIEVAREIRKTDSEVIIIFITQIAQYAIEGYSVQALDYILKPVNYAAFSMKLLQVEQILSSRHTKSLIISNQTGKIKLNLDQIRYIEVSNHTLLYHTQTDSFSSTGYRSLKDLSQELKDAGFARCHHGYLVNLKYVTGYEKNSVSFVHETLPLSRTYYKSFLESLLAYWRNSVSC